MQRCVADAKPMHTVLCCIRRSHSRTPHNDEPAPAHMTRQLQVGSTLAGQDGNKKETDRDRQRHRERETATDARHPAFVRFLFCWERPARIVGLSADLRPPARTRATCTASRASPHASSESKVAWLDTSALLALMNDRQKDLISSARSCDDTRQPPRRSNSTPRTGHNDDIATRAV